MAAAAAAVGKAASEAVAMGARAAGAGDWMKGVGRRSKGVGETRGPRES